MEQLVNFDENVQLYINNRNYNINKQILLNTLDYFKTLYSTKIPINQTVDIDIESSINFNVILNILMHDFYGKPFVSINNFTCEDFIEIIHILMFFSAKTSIISDLIILYTKEHNIPFELLSQLDLDTYSVNNGLKKSIINKIANIIANSSPISIPKEFMHYSFNVFKITFDETNINILKEQLSNKLFTMYNKRILDMNLPTYRNSPHPLTIAVKPDKYITTYSLEMIGTRVIKIFNELIIENSFDSNIVFNKTKIEGGCDIKIVIDNIVVINYKYMIQNRLRDEYNIFDIVADYLVRNNIIVKNNI